jgi:hypothetical protein
MISAGRAAAGRSDGSASCPTRPRTRKRGGGSIRPRDAPRASRSGSTGFGSRSERPRARRSPSSARASRQARAGRPVARSIASTRWWRPGGAASGRSTPTPTGSDVSGVRDWRSTRSSRTFSSTSRTRPATASSCTPASSAGRYAEGDDHLAGLQGMLPGATHRDPVEAGAELIGLDRQTDRRGALVPADQLDRQSEPSVGLGSRGAHRALVAMGTLRRRSLRARPHRVSRHRPSAPGPASRGPPRATGRGRAPAPHEPAGAHVQRRVPGTGRARP